MVFGVCAASQAALITIDFGGLGGPNENPFTSPYTEEEFSVTPVVGDWFEGQNAGVNGNPIPAIFADPVIPGGSELQTGAIQVLIPLGGSFSFQSVELRSGSQPGMDFEILGFFQGSLRLSQMGTIGLENIFTLITSTDENAVLDLLTIELIPTTDEISSMSLDNIVLNTITSPPPVPEPSGLALLGLGLALLARFRRRSNG